MNDLAYLVRQMKAPRIAEAVTRVAEQARSEAWSYEDFLVALLEREVLARQAQGGEARIRAAHFPARKMVEEFDFAYPWPAARAGRPAYAAKSSSTWQPWPSWKAGRT